MSYITRALDSLKRNYDAWSSGVRNNLDSVTKYYDALDDPNVLGFHEIPVEWAKRICSFFPSVFRYSFDEKATSKEVDRRLRLKKKFPIFEVVYCL